VSEQEVAKRVATQAATEAAEKAAKEQKERGSKEMHDARIAQEAARSAVSSFAANQLGDQQGNQPTPSYQSGFVPYSSAAHNAAVQPRAGQEGKTFKRAIFTFSRLVCNFTNEHQRMVKKNSEDLLKWVACKFLCQEQCSKGSPNK
jgi:hypothetical protein